jgi:hypothetical protein
VPDRINAISLARVQSGMVAVRARERGTAVLDVQAPRVVLAKKPTVLVYIDGEPQFVPVKGTSMSGVLNTRTVLLKGASGKLYLRMYDGWVGADALGGPWAVVKPPPEAVKLEQTARATGRANLLRGKPDPKTGAPSLRTARCADPGGDEAHRAAGARRRAGLRARGGHAVAVCDQHLRALVPRCGDEAALRAHRGLLVPRELHRRALGVRARGPPAGELCRDRRQPSSVCPAARNRTRVPAPQRAGDGQPIPHARG